MPGRIGWTGWKSIEITLYACPVKLGVNHWDYIVCLPGRIGWLIWVEIIEISLYACLVKSVELGGNPLRLHCMPTRSNWVEIHWDYIVCLPGQIGWKSIEITLYACPVELVKLGVNHWDYIVCLPGQIGWSIWVEIIEITLYACPVKLGGNPLRLHCMPAWSNCV